MLNTKIAKKKLTKTEQKHLTECGINSMAAMRKQIAFMAKISPEDPGKVCRECRHIALKIEITNPPR